MRRQRGRFRRRVGAVGGWLGLAAGLACGGGSGTGPGAALTANVTPDSLGLQVGGQGQLSAALTGDSGGSVAWTWVSAVPGIASVSQTGLVSGASPGRTIVTATAQAPNGTAHDTAIVVVRQPATLCDGADTLSAWSGTLTVDWQDTGPVNGVTIAAHHQLNASFALSADRPAPPLRRWTGTPTGTAILDETATDQAVLTNAGSGPVASVGDLHLEVNTQDCTWRFDYQYGVNAIANTLPLDPEAMAVLWSQYVPLGSWHTGISYAAGFPSYGVAVAPFQPPRDQYTVVSSFGSLLFQGSQAARTPAQVHFTATPGTP